MVLKLGSKGPGVVTLQEFLKINSRWGLWSKNRSSS
jgi:hypothetical protein